MQRLLLDTHIVLWWLTGNERLTDATRTLIAESECSVSAASVWETAIKHQLGKLDVHPDAMIRACRSRHIRPQPGAPEHGAAIAALPRLHGDPFDRLIVAQARYEHLRLLTVDHRLADYGGDIQLL